MKIKLFGFVIESFVIIDRQFESFDYHFAFYRLEKEIQKRDKNLT